MSSVFQVVWMLLVLVLMFTLLVSELVGSDLVMVLALTLCTVAGLVSVEEVGRSFVAIELLFTLLKYNHWLCSKNRLWQASAIRACSPLWFFTW